MMRPSTKDVKAEKKVSSRYAAMYVPNLTWDFYDAFTSSEPTRLAHARQTISTAENTLDKYLLAARNCELKRNRDIANEGVIQLPRYMKIMKQLQNDNGKFEDLHILLKLLELPKGCMDNFSLKEEWERATYLAITVYRLNPDYFEQLRESYDRALVWAPLSQPIYEARNILLTQAGDGYEPPAPSDENAKSSGTNKDPMKELEKFASNRPKTPSKPIDAEEETLQLVNTLGGDENSPPSSIEGFSHLKGLQAAFAIDEVKVANQRKIVEDIEQRVIRLHDRLEVLVSEIIDCVKRCVDAYNACELFIDRYRKFDELTARLSEGFTGSPAYEDWRRNGVPSYRNAVVEFFNAVQVMAEERLTLQELLQPKGRDWTQKSNPNNARKRWSIIFNGDNLVLKVVHYLDFLRKCRELSDWYGNGFFFAANPLMLPFPVSQGKDLFKMEPLILDQLNTLPYDRKGIANIEQKKLWQHQQFLNDFRRRFFDACKNRVFNWPILPNIREESINEEIFTAFLVMFICAEKSIKKTNEWEKEFIGQISSMRGAANLLVGKPNRKEDKPLLIPPKESRKARPAIFGLKNNSNNNMQFPRTKKSSSTGEDNKSKASTNASIDDDDMDESLLEQFFLQRGNSPGQEATPNESENIEKQHAETMDEDDDDDSFDENGNVKAKVKKVDNLPIVAINRHTERRQSKIAKAQEFQQFLTEAKKRKDMKMALEESDQQAQQEAQSHWNKPRTRGKETMLNLVTHGARKSVLMNRGVPMMGMNMIAALNNTDTGTHKLLAQNSVLTEGSSTSSVTTPAPGSLQKTNNSKKEINDNSPNARRYNNQRSPSRIHLAPPGLVGMTRKSSVASSAVLLARRTSSAGNNTNSRNATNHISNNGTGNNNSKPFIGGMRSRNSVLLVSRNATSANAAVPSLTQIHETSLSSQDNDSDIHTQDDGDNSQAKQMKQQQALANIAALRQSSPLLSRGATPTAAGRTKTSVLHQQQSPPKMTRLSPVRASRASVRVVPPPSAMVTADTSMFSSTSSSTLAPLNMNNHNLDNNNGNHNNQRRVSSVQSLGRKASTSALSRAAVHHISQKNVDDK